MNKSLYFDGRQIKNYLVGFASLFAEIPYRDRDGNIKIVPIHYGSPSDVISFLEKNVDNTATTNRNRIKDVTIPMFSFRMVGIEKNNEKRRAPHDSLTVDLRSLGYKTGYMAMRPAPYKFTMELVCWASSDYQAFEITEQIIPYFNSPQQVKIEPLPRCPVSTTEVFLDNVEIDTDPESQKYSALITMTFSLTGYILSQPKIWSTNMAFELSMLVDNEINPNGNDNMFNDPNTNWSVGNEIRDLNSQPPRVIPAEVFEKYSSLEKFIKNTPELFAEYGITLEWYNLLVKNNRINEYGVVVDSSKLVVEYNGGEKTFYSDTIMMISEQINDVKYVYENEQIHMFIKSQTLEGNLKVLHDLMNDRDETIILYLKLLDNNLVTKGFNLTNIDISNVDKMKIFGTSRINVDDILNRLKNYLASLENFKIYKNALKIKGVLSEKNSIFVFENNIPIESFPLEIKNALVDSYSNQNTETLIVDFVLNKDHQLVIKAKPNLKSKLFIEKNDTFELNEIVFDNAGFYTLQTMQQDKFIGIILLPELHKPVVKGFVLRNLENSLDITTLNYNIFGLPQSYEIGVYNNKQTLIELDKDFFKISGFNTLLDNRFFDMDGYVVSILVYDLIQNNSAQKNDILRIVKQKYGFDYYTIISKAIELKHLIHVSEKYISITSNNSISSLINASEHNTGQQIVAPDLVQVVATDKDGKPIYDANRDGIIDAVDLAFLNVNVDNPEDYYYDLKYGVWHKKFKMSDMTQDRIDKIYVSLKNILFIIEKESYDEIVDFLILVGKNLVTSDFNLYSALSDSAKSREIRSLGYDVGDVEKILLTFRLFLNSVKVIIDEKDFIAYHIKNINEKSNSILYQLLNINFDRLIAGKYLQMYFSTFSTDTIRKEKALIIKPYLTENLAYYMDYYISEFDTLLNDIKKTTLFKECLNVNTGIFENELPNINDKLVKKYGV